MNIIVAANAFPTAGIWILTFMFITAALLLPLFPLILKRRRIREQKELHEKIVKAKEKILEDGIVEGPKGSRVRHIPWGSRRRGGSTDAAGPPKHNAYHGGPWH